MWRGATGFIVWFMQEVWLSRGTGGLVWYRAGGRWRWYDCGNRDLIGIFISKGMGSSVWGI